MANILMIHDGEQPTVLSLYSTMIKFCENNNCRVKKRYTNKLNTQEFNWADVIICVRGESPVNYAVLRCAQENGKYLVYFLDDDLKDIPKGAFRYPERKKWLIKCIGQCSLILTSNQLLANEYKEYVLENKAALIHASVFEHDILKPQYYGGAVKIVYAASEWHISNFDTYIKPILPELFKKYGKDIEMHFIGLHPDIDVGEYNVQIHYTKGMSLQKYNEHMQSNRYDIGLAPLVKNHFTERKYFNKYIEYAKFGICGIYSDVMPYKLVTIDGWNGYLSKNNTEAWLEAIKRAIDNKEERRVIVENSQQHLRDEHFEQKIYTRLSIDIPELIEYKAPKINNEWPAYIYYFKLRQCFFRLCESVYLMIYSLRHFGINKTLERIKKRKNEHKH